MSNSVAICLLLVSLLLGCKTLEKHPATSSIVIQAVTLKVIEESDDRAAQARKIIAAAEDARALLDFEGVSVESLVARVRERIAASDAELSEKVALNGLLTALEAEVRGRIDAGTLDPAEKQTINRVLSLVITAAQAYAG